MAPTAEPLAVFHPLVRRWFRDRFGAPTEVQRRAWPVIAQGKHVLVTAPTGSGKTLTAFLWALDQLLRGAWPGGQVRVLYVSPLKALNTDVGRNLEAPLAELEEVFRRAGEPFPEVRVAIRSGDTPQAERQRMVRRPPEILITTPESLNILLTSKGGRRILGGLTTVILDEIHAVAGSKRGTHLITAVDRLVPLSGEFQRIAISATIRPMERIAELVGGYELEKAGSEAVYRRRPVVMIRAPGDKKYELSVRAVPAAPGDPRPGEKEDSVWPALAKELRHVVRRNRSTLVFANSRRLTERIVRLVNDEDGSELAYSHHGSLSREIRAVVEERLKEGRLAAIVATSSLELGIDVGHLDEVLLVQTPPSVASTVQRLGRAGHGVGEVSRGRLYPVHPRDFLDAAVVGKAVLVQDIEEVRPVENALDVLAQVIVSMVALETWKVDELFDRLRTSFPYRHLKRRQFDLVLQMLAGRYAGSRVRELKPRVSIDGVNGTVRGRDGVTRLVYLSGGTIPDRGYFALRTSDTKAKLGELDEEFVWERSIGDTFALGAQSWRVDRVTHNDVLVSPARGSAGLAPFWRADERDRGPHLSLLILELLGWAEENLADPGFEEELVRRHPLTAPAARALRELLERQRQVTGCALPHRQHIVVEHYADAGGSGAGRRQILIHTLWGGKVNRPFAVALAAAWEERFQTPVEVLQDNDSINVVLGDGATVADVLGLVNEGNLERLLRRRLESTGFFGARFRHNASRALLLPKASFKRRMPLWLSRQKAKKLLEAVAGFDDFPIVMETWRTCLKDEFEVELLKELLGELRRGEIAVSEVYTSAPSPFAEGIVWKQTNQLMYEDDTPERGGGTRIREDLIQELVLSSRLRPRIAPKLVRETEEKLQRTAAGYAPRSPEDLLDWLRERLLIPAPEWTALLAAAERDHGLVPAELEGALAGRALRLVPPGGQEGVAALEDLPRLARALGKGLGGDLREVVEELALSDLQGSSLDASSLSSLLGPLAPSAGTGGEDEEGEADGDDEAEVDEESGLVPLLAEWLRAYGPLPRRRLAVVFGLGEEELSEALGELVEEERVVLDELTEGAGEGELEVCDRENLELLLRLTRSRARPVFKPLELAKLPLALAAHQGLTRPGEDLEGLERRLESLFGYPAPAEAWEKELLPARMAPYFPAWLDSLVSGSDCLWLGCGSQRTTFAFAEDLELFPPEVPEEAPSEAQLLEVFPDLRGRFSFEDLEKASGLGAGELNDRLWAWVWAGAVSTDSLEPWRRGIAGKFSPPPPASRRKSGSRRGRGRGRWRRPPQEAGLWYVLGRASGPVDALEEEELRRDRVRLLLDRYGVLFRELLARELPALRWGAVFRSLRILELGGEVVAGRFFDGAPGLQFASHGFFKGLRAPLPEDAVYWVSAGDPASLCGLDLQDLKGELPARRRGNHLVYHGSRLVVVSEAHGKRLEIRVPADHGALPEYLGFLKVLLSREAGPLRHVEVQEINGEAALESPYGTVLRQLFSATREARGWRLRKSYGGGP